HSRAGRITSPVSSRQTRPCCWPPTATADTSASPPIASMTSSTADHQWCGSTSVPSGCLALACRSSSPVVASRTPILQDWVEESMPATSAMLRCPFLVPVLEPRPGPRASSRSSSAVEGCPSADQVLQCQLVEPYETVVAFGRGDHIELLLGRPEVCQRLPGAEGRLGEGPETGVLHRLGDLRIGTERPRPVSQHQVGLHAGPCRLPHPGHVLGARRLVVEMLRSGVAGGARIA